MTNVNADSANETGLPELLAYIDDVQIMAHRLAGALGAIIYLEDEVGCNNSRFAVSLIAQELANQIAESLDCVNLPKV